MPEQSDLSNAELMGGFVSAYEQFVKMEFKQDIMLQFGVDISGDALKMMNGFRKESLKYKYEIERRMGDDCD